MFNPQQSAQLESNTIQAQLKGKRDDFRVEIRKLRNTKLFTKNRVNQYKNSNQENPQMCELEVPIEDFFKIQYNPQDFQNVLNFFITPESIIDLKAAQKLKDILIQDNSADIFNTNQGFMNTLLSIVKTSSEEIKYYIIWCFSMLACNENFMYKDLKFIQELIPVLIMNSNSQRIDIATISIHALGNIIPESHITYETGCNYKVFDKLHEILDKKQYNIEILISISSLILGIVHNESIQNSEESLKSYYNLVQKIVQIESSNLDIVSNVLKVLSIVLKIDSQIAVSLIQSQKMLELVFKSIGQNIFTFKMQGLMIISSLTMCDDDQVQVLFDMDVLEILLVQLNSNERDMRRQSAYILSNLICGNKQQINQILEHQKLIASLIYHSITDGVDVKREAIRCFQNVFEKCQFTILSQFFTQYKFMEVIQEILKEVDGICLCNAINILDNYLTKSKVNEVDFTEAIKQIQNYNIGNLVEDLQNHESLKVYKMVQGLIERHFTTD